MFIFFDTIAQSWDTADWKILNFRNRQISAVHMMHIDTSKKSKKKKWHLFERTQIGKISFSQIGWSSVTGWSNSAGLPHTYLSSLTRILIHTVKKVLTSYFILILLRIFNQSFDLWALILGLGYLRFNCWHVKVCSG